MKNASPLLFLPGILPWVLLGIGAARHDRALMQIGAVVMFLFIGTGLFLKIRRGMATRREAGRIWGAGKQAKAKVIDISTKGGSLNDNPSIAFDLDVTPVGQPSYRARVEVIVSKLAIPRIQPGCEIDVRIDPSDRAKVVIDEKLTYLGYAAA